MRVLLPQACICEAGVVAGEPEDASGDGPASGLRARAHSSRLLSETLEQQERASHAPRAARVTLLMEGKPPPAEQIYWRTTKMLHHWTSAVGGLRAWRLHVSGNPSIKWHLQHNVTPLSERLRPEQMIPVWKHHLTSTVSSVIMHVCCGLLCDVLRTVLMVRSCLVQMTIKCKYEALTRPASVKGHVLVLLEIYVLLISVLSSCSSSHVKYH